MGGSPSERLADGRNDSITFSFQLARAAFVKETLPQGIEPGLDEEGTYIPTQETFPNGCHVAEVEIDPDTGTVAIRCALSR